MVSALTAGAAVLRGSLLLWWWFKSPRRTVGKIRREASLCALWREHPDLRMGPYPPLVALALRAPGWGFHTVRGGIEPENIFFSSPVGVVHV